MKQKTAIIRAYKRKYDLDSVRFAANGMVYGHRKDEYGNYKVTLGHIEDIWTADHNGHSTRVYCRGTYIGTVCGQIEV